MTITHLLAGNNLAIAGGSLSASGDFGVGGNIKLDGDTTISSVGASDDITINPAAQLNLGTADADEINI